MVLVSDGPDREDEADLTMAAQWVTPEAIAFMLRHGRGLVCMPCDGARLDRLGIGAMVTDAGCDTAFTVSIDHHSVGSGISAADRAATIRAVLDPWAGAADFVRPGHVFPRRAREGGVLVRTGHTEAAVDLARLAGLNPSGVICEIMNDDGTMARRNDLIAFAQRHGLKIGTIADLIAYRRRHDRIVERALESDFDSRWGGKFRMHVYVNRVAHAEHIALVKGDVTTPGPVLVRMHALNVLDEVLADRSSGRGGELHAAMDVIGAAGRGVLRLIREHLPTRLACGVRARIA